MTGRPLRPPLRETALDRAWRRRQWRLERAHDDWGLHTSSGDPRASIHRASGLVRLHRQSVRDMIRLHRQAASATGREERKVSPATTGIADAIRHYRLAIDDLARAVAAFDRRNANTMAPEPKRLQGSTESAIIETVV